MTEMEANPTKEENRNLVCTLRNRNVTKSIQIQILLNKLELKIEELILWYNFKNTVQGIASEEFSRGDEALSLRH